MDVRNILSLVWLNIKRPFVMVCFLFSILVVGLVSTIALCAALVMLRTIFLAIHYPFYYGAVTILWFSNTVCAWMDSLTSSGACAVTIMFLIIIGYSASKLMDHICSKEEGGPSFPFFILNSFWRKR